MFAAGVLGNAGGRALGLPADGARLVACPVPAGRMLGGRVLVLAARVLAEPALGGRVLGSAPPFANAVGAAELDDRPTGALMFCARPVGTLTLGAALGGRLLVRFALAGQLLLGAGMLERPVAMPEAFATASTRAAGC